MEKYMMELNLNTAFGIKYILYVYMQCLNIINFILIPYVLQHVLSPHFHGLRIFYFIYQTIY